MTHWTAATLTLRAGTLGHHGFLTFDDVVLHIRKWRKEPDGTVSCEVRVDDPAWLAYLTRLEQQSRMLKS